MKETAPTLDLYLSQTRIASAVFDAERILQNASPRFLEIFPAGRIQDSSTTVFSNAPLLTEKFTEVCERKNSFSAYEFPLFPDEVNRLYNVEIFPLINADSIFLGAAINIFESRHPSVFSEQKKRADSLSKLDLIAAGLAHEIRNPLSGLKGAADLILSDIDEPEQLKKYAGIIARESERIDRLVRELIDFTKPRPLKHDRINLNQLLHEARITVGLIPDKKIKFVENFDPSLPDIKGDADLLRQIFLNLIKNAVEACPQNGLVKMNSQIVTDVVLKTEAGKRRIVSVKIEDNGCGMNEEQLRNIFTPYYTTKERGTGLGLALVNKFVELHGGSITVKSRLNEGTAFSVFLPV